MANTTMTHSAVNGGTAVILHGVEVTYSWGNLTKTDPIPGKYDITEAENGGFENPKIIIRGNFDVEDISSNEITQDLLVNFATLRSTTPISLSVATGSSPVYLKGRPSGGYETDGAQTLQNSISIQINSFDIKIDTSSETGRFWTYSINCTEVT